MLVRTRGVLCPQQDQRLVGTRVPLWDRLWVLPGAPLAVGTASVTASSFPSRPDLLQVKDTRRDKNPGFRFWLGCTTYPLCVLVPPVIHDGDK